MNVRFRSKWGEIRSGEAKFSNGRGKKTICVVFLPTEPLILGCPTMGQRSNCEEFNLLTGQRYVWGQGTGIDIDDWTMFEEDRTHILDTGGG